MSLYNKNYYECYARLSLITLLDERYGDLHHSEMPDLQGRQLSIGVEVTRSISPDEARNLVTLDSVYEQQCQLNDSIMRKLSKLNRLYRLFESNRLFIFAETHLLTAGCIVNTVAQCFRNSGLPVKYDVIYVDCIDRLYVCCDKLANIRQVSISAEQLRFLESEAEKTQDYDW